METGNLEDAGDEGAGLWDDGKGFSEISERA